MDPAPTPGRTPRTSTRREALNRARARQQAPPAWPADGPARGEVLRWWMQRHSLSYQGLADAAGIALSTVTSWCNGGTRPHGLDMVMQSRSRAVAAFMALVRRLEPEWTDEDVWRTWGVPEGLRETWILPTPPAGEVEVRVDRLEGELISHVPLLLKVVAGGQGGLLLYREGERQIAVTDRMIVPAGWERVGRIVGMVPAL